MIHNDQDRSVPLLCQHTAGAHGTQWRHVLESDEITKDFRVIAYDLPFHGKSVPPEGRAWWAEEYRLTKAFLMQVPVKLSKALGLDRPAYMGSSIGGHLGLDLASNHADDFRAVTGSIGRTLAQRTTLYDLIDGPVPAPA